MQSFDSTDKPNSLLDNNYAYPHYRLIVFAKSPVLGFAKTRLQPTLPQEFSLSLHTRLTGVVLSQWSQSRICPVACWVAGDMENFSEKIFNKNEPYVVKLPTYQQPEGGLGERLIAAINQTFFSGTAVNQQEKSDIHGVFVAGTDCPFIDKDYLLLACEKLTQYDVVIGPADDGGYVLLGLKEPKLSLFTGIRWGESSVFKSTIDKIKAAKLSYFELPSLSDIDQPEDLVKLNAHGQFDDLVGQADLLLNSATDI